jgi:hypothetical protein
MPEVAIEQALCEQYLRKSQDEVPLSSCLSSFSSNTTIIIAQGFEERTCGVLQTFADARIQAERVIVARYMKAGVFDDTNTASVEKLAEAVSPRNWSIVANHNDGEWVHEALLETGEKLLVDITGISNRAMFRTLDNLEASGKSVYIAYTEAQEYWPRKREWEELRRKLTTHENIAEILDGKPWMFGHEHSVELVSGHEGYDASGTGRALIAFLPFKCARLSAVLSDEDYADKLFIAGRPPSSERAWRLDALKEINESVTRGSRVEEISTFGYRNTLAELAGLLFRDDSLLWKYDIHFAALGSKLQTVGSWVFSRMVPSMTVITSVPGKYFKDAFSQGCGTSWVFPLARLGS